MNQEKCLEGKTYVYVFLKLFTALVYTVSTFFIKKSTKITCEPEQHIEENEGTLLHTCLK